MLRSLIVVVVASSVPAQVRFEPHLDLAARINHTMAYDSVRQRICLFGGGYSRNDLWEWDGAGWTLRSALVGPPGRWGHAMAFDPARGRLVVFGGQSFFGATIGELDDTVGVGWHGLDPEGAATAPVAALRGASSRSGSRVPTCSSRAWRRGATTAWRGPS